MIDFRIARVSAASEAELFRWFQAADAFRQAQVLRMKHVQAHKSSAFARIIWLEKCCAPTESILLLRGMKRESRFS